jgi:putative radical SAM enzyme (TIGR03279 family)
MQRLQRRGSDSLRHVSSVIAELPVVTAVADGSVAQLHGLSVGDHVVSINGIAPRDLIEWQSLVSDYPLEMVVLRGNQEIILTIESGLGSETALPFGADVHSALFDRIQTCDNHCEFCFIYQLPKGMRRSLYLKDDDYRLSFLYGNFTTLTRFTEADLERVVAQNLSPLYVSVHAADPRTRAEMLRNDRGGVSLRWLRQLLNHGVDVRAQIVLCPGVNDGQVLEHTLGVLLDEMPEITSIAVVPLGLSKHNTESRMRVHTPAEAREAIEIIEKWQQRFEQCLSRSVVHAADELYLVANRTIPQAVAYGEFEMLEDGVGLVRQFVDTFHVGNEVNSSQDSLVVREGGFFASVDKEAMNDQGVHQVESHTQYVRAINPAIDTSLRARKALVPDVSSSEARVTFSPTRRQSESLGVLTGSYGAQIISPLLASYPGDLVHVHEIRNEYFGGNTKVAGLLTYEDIERHLQTLPNNRMYLLPDVCLNEGRFLDGKTIQDLQSVRHVKVIPSSGGALRAQIDLFMAGVAGLANEKRTVSHG